MIKRTKNVKKYVLITPLMLVSLTGQLAHADIFKWKDSHGVTQYSDAPPVSNVIKATRSEVVNALQKKDLCAEPVTKKLINFSNNESVNFFRPSFREVANNSFTTSTNGNSVTSNNKNAFNPSDRNNFLKVNAASSSNFTKKIIVAYNPFKQNTVFNIGNKKVRVLTAPSKAKSGASQSSALNATPFSNLVIANPLSTNTVFATNSNPIVVAALPSSSGVTIPSTLPEPVKVALATSSSTPVATTSTSSTSSSIVQKDLMPAVNIAKNMAPVAGFADLRIRPNMGSYDIPPVGDGWGQFRIDCAVSHMSNDDPLVYPNQQGAAHHHTFFGNTSINFKSNLTTLSTTGNSTCRGGIANRSAYWVPSMIDTATATPLKQYSSLWYYKTG